MLCSISGHVPETPVLSVKSGLLFEKRLIEQEIEEHGVCPITKEPLATEDLIDGAKPRTAAANSIPGLLGIFHDEWDALMLECHSLRQSLSTARQELSHALYQHDAACRVIARLVRERDAAKETLLKLQSSKRALPETEEDTAMEEHPIKKVKPICGIGREAEVLGQMHMGITKEICEFIEKASAESAKEREHFEVSEQTATTEAMQGYSLLTSQPLHATKQGKILSVQYHPTLRNILASAGEDCTIKIFDQSSSRLVASIEEHFKKVNAIDWFGEVLLLSCSADKSVRIWMREEDSWEMTCGLSLKNHEEEVMAVTGAQNGRFAISASKDATLGLIDLEQGKCLERLEAPVVDCAYASAQFHPDGRLLATGTEAGDLHLWDMVQQKIVKSFEASSSVKSLSFHEAGDRVASASAESVVLWDLRKMDSVKELSPYDEASVECVRYDTAGRYLAVGGADVRVYDTTENEMPVVSFADFPGPVRCLAFSALSHCLAAGSTDHNVRLFGTEEQRPHPNAFLMRSF